MQNRHVPSVHFKALQGYEVICMPSILDRLMCCLRAGSDITIIFGLGLIGRGGSSPERDGRLECAGRFYKPNIPILPELRGALGLSQ